MLSGPLDFSFFCGLVDPIPFSGSGCYLRSFTSSWFADLLFFCYDLALSFFDVDLDLISRCFGVTPPSPLPALFEAIGVITGVDGMAPETG